ncbi:hypothetical protein EI42_05745 [Thermosporothrix hazakensis]|jgi:cobalamin biosynthesis Co2+ chelatase CbiK|uniref:Uncharacterized protein n=1 Tax=Thermosporothrix hazakensis TaxID=644383 RepID=A0A326TWX1_THEHA|nr:hypothetical protein [Thermosporothrix hazakensis]PZW20984.1 hypothetical protein EI42_05745 [Thermosporothrix hazakensis]GCE49267.1 hypothetical protein KTH_41360 [Thermosporothrix hazakensis]
MEIIPYSNPSAEEALPLQLPPAREGAILGVYILLRTSDYQFILHKIIGWFAEREEVVLIDHGTTDKLGLGYIILEWLEGEIDSLFLAILRDEELVADYNTYLRD